MTWQTELVDEVAAAAAALLPTPATAQEIADLVKVPTPGQIAQLVDVPTVDEVVAAVLPQLPAPVSVTSPMQRTFDSFPGATDDEKVAAMNAWHLGLPSGRPSAAVIVDRLVTHTVPILLVSGMVLASARPGPAREYSRAPGFRYRGPDGTAQFVYLVDQAAKPVQPAQSYPSDNSVRDATIIGLQLEQTATTDLITSTVYRAGAVLWYVTFDGCGLKNGRRWWHGTGTGVNIVGVTHIQGYADQVLKVGGSECLIFGAEQSCADSTLAAWAAAGKPMIESTLEKSAIGNVMVTARKTAYALLVSGGHSSRFSLRADAQDSDPMYGAAIRVTGGEGHVLEVGIKGAMANPALAAGGAAANRADLMITGGSGHVIAGSQFSRVGTPAPATTPVVFVGPNVPTGGVVIGLNTYAKGAPRLVHQSKAGQVICTDPSVTVATVP